jgi:hypothetical protein
MSSQLNLENVRRKTGGDEPSSDQKILPATGTKMAGACAGGKAHITRNWESP